MNKYSIGVAVLFLLTVYVLSGGQTPRFGDTSNTNPVTVATSSNPTVGTTASLVFATSTCATRTITAPGSSNGVMITFTDNQGKHATATYGHYQAASSTVLYDASQVGCGAVYIYSFVSAALSVSESR